MLVGAGRVELVMVLVAGVALLVVIAVVVTLVDAVRAPVWREVAAQRRRAWEEARDAGHDAPTPRSVDVSDLPGSAAPSRDPGPAPKP